MEISKIMKRKIMLLKERREHLDRLEREVFEWFKNRGIDIEDDSFINTIGDKICYGEYNNIEDIESYLREYLNNHNS